MLATIGTTMIVSTRQAGSSPTFDGVPEKSGMKPKWSLRNGSTCGSRNGPMTRIPHRPRTTLGMAARSSTSDAHRRPQPPRGELAQEEADRDRDRHREHQRERRRHQRCPRCRSSGAELVGDRVPLGRGEEPEAERRDGRGSLVDHLVRDQHQGDHDQDGGRPGHQPQGQVAEMEPRPSRESDVCIDVRAQLWPALLRREGAGAAVGGRGAGATPAVRRSRRSPSWRTQRPRTAAAGTRDRARTPGRR